MTKFLPGIKCFVLQNNGNLGTEYHYGFKCRKYFNMLYLFINWKERYYTYHSPITGYKSWTPK